MKTPAADRAVSAERALNTAIVNADITRGYEEYLALVDQYYAEARSSWASISSVLSGRLFCGRKDGSSTEDGT
jgi:hypothetical protein